MTSLRSSFGPAWMFCVLACFVLGLAWASPAMGAKGEDPDEIIDDDTRLDDPCGNPSCNCGDACGCGVGCRCGIGLGDAPAFAADTQTYPSSNVVLIKRLALPDFGQFTSGSDCWGYVSPGGREYVFMGLNSGVSFVDITDPANPVVIGHVTMPSSFWKDTAVHAGHAYLVSDSAGDGIRIVSIKDIDNGNISVVGTVNPGGVTKVHSSFKHGSFLYLCGSDAPTNGLVALNLSNPLSPTVAGTYSSGGYVHDVQVHTYTSGPYAGREIAFCFMGSAGIDVVDVTNKSAMTRLSRKTYPGLAYAHQGWFEPTTNLLYMNDELDERNNGATPSLMRIFDATNLSSLQLVGTFTTGLDVVDHNCYIKDGFIYAANYRSGLRILDVRTTPLNPVEVGFFDTFPGADAKEFNGAWSVYPYYNSGKVVISDIESGLFIVDPTFALNGGVPLAFSFPDGLPSMVSAGVTVRVRIEGINGGAIGADEPKMTVTTAQGAATVGLVSLGGDLYRATFPAMACPGEARFHFTAASANKLLVNSPLNAPIEGYTAVVAAKLVETFADDFEASGAWTIGAPGDNATGGVWVRVDPVGTAAQPEDDTTPPPGIRCFVTGNGAVGGALGAADIDGGTTTLTSPVMDASGEGEWHIAYNRWYSNNMGSAPGQDSMPIQISNDGGSSWTQLELVTENAGAWVHKRFRIADFLAPTAQMRLRVQARDLAPASVVEAGLDDVKLESVVCAEPTPPDLTGDGLVNAADLAMLLGSWGVCGAPCPADLDGDGFVGSADLAALLGSWTNQAFGRAGVNRPASIP